MIYQKPREGEPPWNDRWPCPHDPYTHAVRLDQDGKALFHYTMPGVTQVCPGSGQPFKE